VLPIARPWLLPLVTALGGAISGLIVFTFAPEAEGHGTDSAIAAIHHKRGRIRARIPPIKLIASAITIGTGGSGGREGPTAQISAGFGSLLGQWLGLSAQDRRIAVAVGMGAGIGAIFRAPLGGAVMAAEILYIHDLEVESLIPTLIASIVGYAIYGGVYGYVPIFGDQARLGFTHPVQLLYYALLGVVSGLGGLLYDRSFYGITGLFHRLALPRWLKPALAGLLVGTLGLIIPGALHTGYGWVQISMGPGLLALPLWVVLLLPFAKILATSLSIGSGGSGGIFGPGMVIGGFLGAAFWRLTHNVLPQMPLEPAPFVIIGMIALFGGIAHAPGGDADGGRDDRQPVAAGAGDGRGRHLDGAGRRPHDLPQPAAHSRRLAGAPGAV
jgi:CIC family chloride channel protein